VPARPLGRDVSRAAAATGCVASIALARIFASPRRSIAGGIQMGWERARDLPLTVRLVASSRPGSPSDCLCHSNAIARRRSLLRFRVFRAPRYAFNAGKFSPRRDRRDRLERSLDKPIINVTIKNNVTHSRYLTPASRTLESPAAMDRSLR